MRHIKKIAPNLALQEVGPELLFVFMFVFVSRAKKIKLFYLLTDDLLYFETLPYARLRPYSSIRLQIISHLFLIFLVSISKLPALTCYIE